MGRFEGVALGRRFILKLASRTLESSSLPQPEGHDILYISFQAYYKDIICLYSGTWCLED